MKKAASLKARVIADAAAVAAADVDCMDATGQAFYRYVRTPDMMVEDFPGMRAKRLQDSKSAEMPQGGRQKPACAQKRL